MALRKRRKRKVIPKVIHNTGPADRSIWPSEWHVCFSSQKKHFSDFEFVFWDDDKMEELVETKFPWFKKVWDQYPHQIFKADMIRPMILYLYGGLYLDLDMYCEKNVYSDLDQERINLLGSWETSCNHPPYTNAFMASAPENKYWIKLIQTAMRKWNGSLGRKVPHCGKDYKSWPRVCLDLVLQLTGPTLLSDLPETEEQNILNCGEYEVNSKDNPLKHICTGSWYRKPKYNTKNINHMNRNTNENSHHHRYTFRDS